MHPVLSQGSRPRSGLAASNGGTLQTGFRGAECEETPPRECSPTAAPLLKLLQAHADSGHPVVLNSRNPRHREPPHSQQGLDVSQMSIPVFIARKCKRVHLQIKAVNTNVPHLSLAMRGI